MDDPVITSIASDLNVQPAQLCVQWAVQRGTIALPKSVTPSRIEANFQDFHVPEEAVERINKLDRKQRNNFPSRLGVDIFGEVKNEEVMQRGVREWVEKQKAANKA